ncbi:E2F transcription factor-like E2FF [Gastrolobium bilobum]|uniref:E2F transcription factor-like E2FF n=1 Tax=Gastrolobium bilobum TaxID=150636 RepID=UPI002AB1E856|nr:E2F transcription factor-like E2FF [Gastrolobium bilobum]
MSTSVSQESESAPPQIYSRKDKSLGLLCSNFLKLYNREGSEMIELDDAAARLGVQRRRMYDVVNILESVGIVARKARNIYSWKGFKEIPRALEELKEEVQRENLDAAYYPHIHSKNATEALNNKENGGSEIDTKNNPLASFQTDCRRDKSLAFLTQNFIKLFLFSDVELVLLEDAATKMPGDSRNSIALRTKIRRLYDIANVLSTINLIEKTNSPGHRKTAYRWLGWKAITGSDDALDKNASKKRVFGAEITNCSLKRNKADSLMDPDFQKKRSYVYNKAHDLENTYNDGILKQQPSGYSKAVDFGPFAPNKF